MAETLAQKHTRYAKEDQEVFQRIRDFGVGIIKGVTTDLPGFLADIGDKLAGDTAVLGGKDRSAQLFKAATGVETAAGSPAQKLGEVTNPAAFLKAIMVPAFMVKGLPAVREATRALAKDPKKAEEIFRETGIFASPSEDGVMRAIIDDSQAAIRTDSAAVRTWASDTNRGPQFLRGMNLWEKAYLPDVLDHPKLYDAIPSLKDTKVGPAGMFDFQQAFYNRNKDYIGIGSFPSPTDFMTTLLHETQHAVQSKTGLTGGGNPNMFVSDAKRLDDAIMRAKEMKDLAFIALKKEASALGENIYKMSDSFKASSVARRLETTEGALDTLQVAQSRKIPQYSRLAGEAEARAVEAMYKQGGNKYPLSYYDVPLTSIIEDASFVKKVDDDPVTQAIINSVLRNPAALPPAKK